MSKYIQNIVAKVKHLKAFTLAEVLITLSIIGVIASMTIPSLVQDVQDAQLRILWKKAYSTASQAWKMVVAENPNTYTGRGGWTCTWPTGETKDYEIGNDGRTLAFISKLNIVKECLNQEGCWPLSFEKGPGGIYNHAWVTSDGMCWTNPYFSDPVHMAVDTNCAKGPNKQGQDIFWMLLGADGNVYFAIDDKSPGGKPVSSGRVCPWSTEPATINGRTVNYKDGLRN